MTMINAYDSALAEVLSPDDRALIDRRAKALGPAYRLFYDQPLHIERSEGVWLPQRKACGDDALRKMSSRATARGKCAGSLSAKLGSFARDHLQRRLRGSKTCVTGAGGVQLMVFLHCWGQKLRVPGVAS